MCRRPLWGGGSGGVFTGDAAAEGLEAGDEAPGFAVGVGAAIDAVGAEVVIRCAGDQDVPHDHEDRMGNGDDALVPSGLVVVAVVVSNVPVVERFEVAMVPDGGPGYPHQPGLQVGVAVAATAGVPMPTDSLPPSSHSGGTGIRPRSRSHP